MLCFHLFKWPLPLGMEESTVLCLGSISNSYSCSAPSLYCVAALYGPRTWTQWNRANLGHGKARVSLSPSVVLQDQKGPQWFMSSLCTSCRVFSPTPEDCDQPHSHWVFLSVWVVGFPFCAVGSWSLPSFSGRSLVTLPSVTEHQQGYISGRWLFHLPFAQNRHILLLPLLPLSPFLPPSPLAILIFQAQDPPLSTWPPELYSPHQHFDPGGKTRELFSRLHSLPSSILAVFT